MFHFGNTSRQRNAGPLITLFLDRTINSLVRASYYAQDLTGDKAFGGLLDLVDRSKRVALERLELADHDFFIYSENMQKEKVGERQA